MKVLVATKESQGDLPGDYSWTIEGELVTAFVCECRTPKSCGCGRGFPGLASARATTTAMVVDRPELDRDELWDALYDAADRQGWIAHLDPDEAEELVDEHVACIDIVCDSYPVGTIVGRWGTKVWSRSMSAAA